MTKTVFYLKTCGTNKKIMTELDLQDWKLREIKSKPISEEELSEMYVLAGSYDTLFSRKSQQIKAKNIDVNSLSEQDKRDLILSHYSFLKRPVFMTDKEIFIGSDKNNIEKLHNFFKK